MRFHEGRRASGSSTRARPAGQAPQRNHVNPHEDWTCVHPHGFVSVQFSRNRCRLAADSQSLSGLPRSQEFFFGSPGGAPRRKTLSLVPGILFSGKIGPGGHRRGRWKIRKSPRHVKRKGREKREKCAGAVCLAAPARRRGPSEGDLTTRPATTPAQGLKTLNHGKYPLSLSGIRGYHRRTFPS